MRTLGPIALIAFIGFATFWLITHAPGGDGSATEEASTDVDIAKKHQRSVRELSSVVDDALRNAREAEELGREIDEIVARSAETADEVGRLALDNEAATTSADVTVEAGRDAAQAAILMRQYAANLKAELRDTVILAEQAEDLADVVNTVEESQAEANEAAARAEAARQELASVRAKSRNNAATLPMQPASYTTAPSANATTTVNTGTETTFTVRPISESQGHASDQQASIIVLPNNRQPGASVRVNPVTEQQSPTRQPSITVRPTANDDEVGSFEMSGSSIMAAEGVE